MTVMREEDIPAFVRAIVEAGFDIRAIGDGHYCLGDEDNKDVESIELINRVSSSFGTRRHLLPKIVQYLRSEGRYIEVSDVSNPQHQCCDTNDGRLPK